MIKLNLSRIIRFCVTGDNKSFPFSEESGSYLRDIPFPTLPSLQSYKLKLCSQNKMGESREIQCFNRQLSTTAKN
ncbi:hypothetical protein GDO81_015597 [Engystomops pustulosus]|uniref:Uncharacterized protein n=1 Tax=Engystomops pustulosus TaxID=76066 RepID=A0AAV7AVJ5_ENGPU|nr:hypothetical protein GDO81_015597 [Engystomops pustulosus]